MKPIRNSVLRNAVLLAVFVLTGQETRDLITFMQQSNNWRRIQQ